VPRRLVASVLMLVLSGVFAQPTAAADCALCLESVALQTRDGQPWIAGQPVTLVLRIGNDSAVPLPAAAQAVVMQTDGDRTKCLGVPLKLVESDASGALYAGVFFPFRPAVYDGKLSIGDDLHDITFDVNQMVAGPAPAGNLPAAEPLDTAPQCRWCHPSRCWEALRERRWSGGGSRAES
jgi:hypothetical protein